MPRSSMPQSTQTKSPRPTDIHVGAKLKMRRLQMRMSQSDIANALGLTFQQVQKYENGANRISASKLHAISELLDVPIAFFFQGSGTAPSRFDAEASIYMKTLSTSDGLALMTAFRKITAQRQRAAIVALVREIARASLPLSR